MAIPKSGYKQCPLLASYLINNIIYILYILNQDNFYLISNKDCFIFVRLLLKRLRMTSEAITGANIIVYHIIILIILIHFFFNFSPRPKFPLNYTNFLRTLSGHNRRPWFVRHDTANYLINLYNTLTLFAESTLKWCAWLVMVPRS